MRFVVHSSIAAPVKEVASDLSTEAVVIYIESTSIEMPPLNVQLAGELSETNPRGPGVIHHNLQTDTGEWFDCYTYGDLAGFGPGTASRLVADVVKLWREDGEKPRFSVEMDEPDEIDELVEL